MKTKISAWVAAAAALCIGVQSADANLLGMPLNLKASIEHAAVGVPSGVCQFYTDDLLTGSLLVGSCWRS